MEESAWLGAFHKIRAQAMAGPALMAGEHSRAAQRRRACGVAGARCWGRWEDHHHRAVGRGRNYTWTTAFTVPIEVRVA